MKLVARVGLALALVSLAACGGKQTQSGQPGAGGEQDRLAAEQVADSEAALPAAKARSQREIPSAAQPMPGTLLATLVVGDPNALLGAVRSTVAQIDPKLAGVVHAGFFDQAIAELTNAQRISGLDYSKPVRVLILDPMAVNPPALVVAGVSDEGALLQAVGDGPTEVAIHEGFAVMGTAQALDAAFGYAVTTMLGEPVPSDPTATLYLGKFMAAHAEQVEAMMPMAQAAISQSMPPDEAAQALAAIEGFINFIKQVDILKASLEGSDAAVSIKLAALPVAQTGLAKFIGEQKPATFAQLAAVEPGMFVFAGRLAWKEIYDKMMGLAGSAYKTLYGDQTKVIMEMQKAWAEVMGEEFAMTGGYSAADGMWIGGVWEISDAKKVNQILNKFFNKMPKKIGTKGAEMNLKFRRNALRHRGVALNEMQFQMAKGAAPEATEALEKIFGKGGMKVLFGAFAKTSVMAMGKDAAARIKASIDVGKGKKAAFAANPGLESALARAKELKESMVFALDLPPVLAAAQGAPAVAPGSAGEPAVFAIGFADGAVGARFTLPLSQVKALVPAMGP